MHLHVWLMPRLNASIEKSTADKIKGADFEFMKIKC